MCFGYDIGKKTTPNKGKTTTTTQYFISVGRSDKEDPTIDPSCACKVSPTPSQIVCLIPTTT